MHAQMNMSCRHYLCKAPLLFHLILIMFLLNSSSHSPSCIGPPSGVYNGCPPDSERKSFSLFALYCRVILCKTGWWSLTAAECFSVTLHRISCFCSPVVGILVVSPAVTNDVDILTNVFLGTYERASLGHQIRDGMNGNHRLCVWLISVTFTRFSPERHQPCMTISVSNTSFAYFLILLIRWLQ